MILSLIGVAVGAATYLYVKNKKNSTTGTAAMAGLATGAGTAALVSLTWPLLIIGVPAAGLYYYGKARGEQKALGPHRD